MSRSLRRHPVTAKRQKGRPGFRPTARPSPSRPAPGRESRSTLAAAGAWRPRFVTDIITELRKVVWPGREDVVHLTIVVVVVALLIGAILGAIDVGFGWLIDRILLR